MGNRLGKQKRRSVRENREASQQGAQNGSAAAQNGQVEHTEPRPGPRYQPHPQSSPAALWEASVVRVVALYSYRKRDEDDLDFDQGDSMIVLSGGTEDWLYVRHEGTLLEGYAPANYVQEVSSATASYESREWFHGNIKRQEAERLLHQSNLPLGAFLIRGSSVGNGALALSLRVAEAGGGGYAVKHYKIRRPDHGGGGWWISRNVVLDSLDLLVDEHSKRGHGLVHTLTTPCPRDVPLTELDRGVSDRCWELDRACLVRVRKLGNGCFGDVWYGRWKGEQEIAIKELRRDTMSPEAFLDEAGVMKKCRHHKLVKLFGVCTTPESEPIYIVTEFMVNGDLLTFLKDPARGQALKENQLIYVAAQVADAMRYLELNNIIHRDLAARNVLVGERLTCKVADFGLARCLQEKIYSAKPGGKLPVKWTAPEAVQYNRFTHKSDAWSFGVLLYELFTYGGRPYAGWTTQAVLSQVTEAGYRLPLPKAPKGAPCTECPKHIYTDIMLQCWKEDPDERPTFDYLFSFFENYAAYKEGSAYREIDD